MHAQLSSPPFSIYFTSSRGMLKDDSLRSNESNGSWISFFSFFFFLFSFSVQVFGFSEAFIYLLRLAIIIIRVVISIQLAYMNNNTSVVRILIN
jgi:hypothetical protein